MLQSVQENRNILDTTRQHKLRWMGRILQHDLLLRDMIESGCWATNKGARKCSAPSQAKTTSLWRERQKIETAGSVIKPATIG